MPRFFDDYSNTYLTHDSAAGRKQQRRGWKFRENFKLHYQKQLEEWRSGDMGLASAQQAYIRSSGGNNVPPLPEGWKEEFDDATKATYYIQEATNERTWVRPGFLPPGPGGGMNMNMNTNMNMNMNGGMGMGMMGGPPPRNMNMRGPGGPPGQGPPPPLMHRGPPPPIMNMPPSNGGPPPRGPPPPMFVPPPNLPPPNLPSGPPPPMR